MRRGAIAAIAAGTAFLLVALGAEAKPRVKTKAFGISYFLVGTYTNADSLGQTGCNVNGHENADFDVDLGANRVKLKLASGAEAFRNAADFTTGSWSDSGTRWHNPGGADCSTGVGPLQCGGRVTSGPSSVIALVHRGAVFLTFDVAADPAAAPFGEVGTDSCGGPDYVLPYLGLIDTLDPWRHVQARTSLRALATLKKHHRLTLKVRRDPLPAGSSWDPATCNGVSGGDRTCTSSLKIAHIGLRITAD